MVDGQEDRTHHLLRVDTPEMDAMDARTEADGIPIHLAISGTDGVPLLLVTTEADGGLLHLIIPVPDGDPLDLATPEEEDGVPLHPEAVGVNRDWWNATTIGAKR